jgi:hypothetical protein
MFTVQWVQGALDELTEVWLRAGDRGAISEAVDRIDRQLARSPDVAGESRDHGRRIILEPPLGVIVEVRTDDRTVLVLTVWYYEKRRPGP